LGKLKPKESGKDVQRRELPSIIESEGGSKKFQKRKQSKKESRKPEPVLSSKHLPRT